MNTLRDVLLLGIDGGGSCCRASLCSLSGAKLGEGTGGPANIRLGLDQSFASVLRATTQCMSQAGLSPRDFGRIVACLGLAGASEPTELFSSLYRTLTGLDPLCVLVGLWQTARTRTRLKEDPVEPRVSVG
jgi:N-acetylglucosamine kinase-like BadF-type ATPase